ncbi:MAG: hypothetical protein WCJ30_11155 [Deltaproteobacteria bacterium]
MSAPSAAPTAEIRAVPLQANESIGDRINRARSLLDQLELEQAIGLLIPLHDAPNVPAALAIEAAILETNGLVAMQRLPEATSACVRAVQRANYNPEVAHEQAPRIQAVCHAAAERARHDLVATRTLAIRSVAIQTGAVAWNPVRIEGSFEGELAGFTTQAEVVIGSGQPFTVNLTSTGQPLRSVMLEASLASPNAEVRVTPLIRDEYGVLVRADAPTIARIPTPEAAVRFALGTDEGPLRVDGASTGAQAHVGDTIPLAVGQHTIEVQARSGVTARASVTLHRGEIATLTVHGTAGSTLRDVARWGSTVGGVLVLGAGAVFQFFAASNAAQLNQFALTRDSNTGQPLIDWAAVAPINESRVLDQTLATGFFIGGGVLAGVAIVLWALPSNRETAAPARATAFRVTPTASGFGFAF